MIKIEKIDDFQQLVSIKEQWNNLLSRSQVNTIFQTFEWISAWWKAFGEDYKLFVLLIKRDDELIGIAPLVSYDYSVIGIKLQRIQFIGEPWADYLDFIIPQNHENIIAKVVDFLLGSSSNWHSIRFRQLPQSSPTWAVLKSMAESKGLLFLQSSSISPQVKIEDGWEEYQNSMSKKLRKNIQYSIRSMEKRGALDLQQMDSETESTKMLEEFFALHQKRWQAMKVKSAFSQQKNRAFFSEITKNMSGKDWIDFSVLKWNNRTIAMHFGYRYNKTFYYYIPTFDYDYRKYSPGSILVYKLLEDSFSRKLKLFDFLRGKEPYKELWANTKEVTYAFNLFKRKPLSKSYNLYLINRLRELRFRK